MLPLFIFTSLLAIVSVLVPYRQTEATKAQLSDTQPKTEQKPEAEPEKPTDEKAEKKEQGTPIYVYIIIGVAALVVVLVMAGVAGYFMTRTSSTSITRTSSTSTPSFAGYLEDGAPLMLQNS